MEIMEIVQQMKDKDFVGYCTPGCGSLLGLRLLVQHLGRFILVNSPGCAAGSGAPSVNLGMNAAATASGTARATNGLVVAFASDDATEMHLSSLIDACSRGDRFVYICYNNLALVGRLSEKSLIRSIAPYAAYAATASVAYPEDFLEKLNRAVAVDGVKFIELLAPCPSASGFDTSNTIEVARLATECALWPLFETENKKINLTKRPLRLEPVSRYYAVLKYQIKEDALQKIQDRTNKNWKSLSEGKFL